LLNETYIEKMSSPVITPKKKVQSGIQKIEKVCIVFFKSNQFGTGSKMTTKSGSIILHHMMSYDGWGHHMMGLGHHMMGLGHHMMGCGHHMMGGAIILHHMISYDGWQFSG
jgi:hypothetical protein